MLHLEIQHPFFSIGLAKQMRQDTNYHAAICTEIAQETRQYVRILALWATLVKSRRVTATWNGTMTVTVPFQVQDPTTFLGKVLVMVAIPGTNEATTYCTVGSN